MLLLIPFPLPAISPFSCSSLQEIPQNNYYTLSPIPLPTSLKPTPIGLGYPTETAHQDHRLLPRWKMLRLILSPLLTFSSVSQFITPSPDPFILPLWKGVLTLFCKSFFAQTSSHLVLHLVLGPLLLIYTHFFGNIIPFPGFEYHPYDNDTYQILISGSDFTPKLQTHRSNYLFNKLNIFKPKLSKSITTHLS